MREVLYSADMILGKTNTLQFLDNLRRGQFDFFDGQSGQLVCRISQKTHPGLRWGPNGGIGGAEQEEGWDAASRGEMGDAAVVA